MALTLKQRYERLLTHYRFVQQMPNGDTWTRGKRTIIMGAGYLTWQYKDDRKRKPCNDTPTVEGETVERLETLLKFMEG